MNSLNQLDTLAQQFALFRTGACSAHAFSDQARRNSALLSALPPAFSEVLNQLLDRLESSALFSEESCSFSQQDLMDQLQIWIDKARSRLA